MGALLLLLTGALITLVANVFLQRWKYGREAIDKRCDEIEKVATELATLSREYWLQRWPADMRDAIHSPSDGEILILSQEARIFGCSQRLQGLNALVVGDFGPASEQRLSELFAILSDQATGGKFEVKKRPIDLLRARSVDAAAADYIVAVRQFATERWGVSVIWQNYTQSDSTFLGRGIARCKRVISSGRDATQRYLASKRL